MIRNASNLRPIARTKPYSNLTVHHWNANRITNKTTTLVDHVIEYDVDIMFITETWLAENDLVVIGECKPLVMSFEFPKRGGRDGGGIGVLYKKTLNLIISHTGFNSVNFEHYAVTLKNSIQFIVIYHPPPSKVNGLKTSEFLDDIEMFLDELCVVPESLVLIGDFNVHMDRPDKWDTKRFNDSLMTTGFRQFIDKPTHKSNHILDLLITRETDDLIQVHDVHPEFYSDHHIITCIVKCAKPPPLKIVTSSRPYGKLDPDLFNQLLKDRLVDFPYESNDPNVLAEAYETITSSVLDEVCPVVTKERTIRPQLPWYNENVHIQRRERRRLERKWRKSRKEEDYEAFQTQKELVNKSIITAKTEYFSDKFSNANAKDMYATINGLLNKSTKALPALESKSEKELADDFLSFFISKVEKIRANVDFVDQGNITDPNQVICTSMHGFESLETGDVEKIVMKFPSKTCSLDTLPTWLVKDNLAILIPIITKVVNSSLFSGTFPDTLKQSIITPVLKKSNLDHNILKHYRPVANIKFLSKVIEKAASCQVGSHIDRNDLGERNQSSYKQFHSTETALLKVKNDLLQYVDDSKTVLLVLLDMSAAFDTVDHPILLQRLRDRFGMCDSVVSWFRSYFENRTTRVSIKNALSNEHVLTYSLPQGSIIGPQGFILYISPIGI
ncbi:uncharacterized protein [Amphiura filiformis]|uniref:uncharacterized protein n=1 Tax=Amphiura filiformis TaxID=82378 RepID=UPI003B21995E